MLTLRGRSKVVGLALAALLSLTGCSAALPGLTITAQRTPFTASAQAGPSEPASLKQMDQALEQIYQDVSPSVVNITVKVAAQGIQQPQGQYQFPNLPGRPQAPNLPPVEPARPQFRYGEGSGFVWDSAGHIVTNNHVVDGAEEVTVTFADDTVATATVVGTDPASDLAVLKVDVSADKLHPVTLGDSSQVQVGEHVAAIGNPFGLSGTMTSGIVSAIGRVLPQNPQSAAPGFSIPDIIQTDAAINPGNSGGPLLDGSGTVIGVNFQIESSSGSNDGIGFAIPINTAQQVIPELIKSGHVEHAWLGIEGRTVTPDLAKALDLPVGQGAQVISVVKGGPADQVGLQGSDKQATVEGQNVPAGGDIIVAANGQAVHKMEDLITIVTHHAVGDRLDLTVRRGSETEHVTVTLGARPTQVPQSDSTNP
ncbi:MAG TPA: hypothetical protein DEP84_10565 [Chloroflexi bacterium]|nr:hypothetical protein [Chloroflexota bacterium]